VLVVWHCDLHSSGLFEEPPVVEFVVKFCGAVKVPPVPPVPPAPLAPVELAAAETLLARLAGSCGRLVWFGGLAPDEPDVILILESVYQKQKTLTTVSTAQTSVRFNAIFPCPTASTS
jgi:hypothetical protein